MTAGLAVLAIMPASTPLWVLSALMMLVGVGGPLVMPPITAVLLNSVPAHQTGRASGVFNTSRQIGGALAVAVFGTFLATPGLFTECLRTSSSLPAYFSQPPSQAGFCQEGSWHDLPPSWEST